MCFFLGVEVDGCCFGCGDYVLLAIVEVDFNCDLCCFFFCFFFWLFFFIYFKYNYYILLVIIKKNFNYYFFHFFLNPNSKKNSISTQEPKRPSLDPQKTVTNRLSALAILLLRCLLL